MLRYLYTVSLMCVVAWSSWAVFGGLSILVLPLIFILAACLRWATTLFRVIAVFCILLLLIALLLPAMSTGREAARRTTCMNNLRQISLALQVTVHPPGNKEGAD